MPIDPQNPNDPNVPDFSKLLNFEEVRKNIDNFFNEMVQQLQQTEPEVKQMFSGIEAAGKKAFQSIGKESEKAFDKAEKAALKVEKATEKAMDKFRAKAKQTYSITDFEKLQAEMLTQRRRVDEYEKKEQAAKHALEMKYLKATLTKEEYAIAELLDERDKLLEHIEDEYNEKKNSITAEIKDEKRKTDALIALDKERERRKASLRKSMEEKEQKVRKEGSAMGQLQGVLAPSAIMGRAKTDIIGMLSQTLSKFSSVAVLLGGVSAILLKIFMKAQEQLVRQGRQSQLSFAATGKLNTSIAEQAWETLNKRFASLGQRHEDIDKLLEILAASPDTLKEITNKNASALDKLVGRVCGMGSTVEEVASLVAHANLQWGISTEELLKIQEKASAFNKLTGLTTLETMNSFINLNSQLRKVSTSTRDAATLMVLAGKKPEEIGAKEFQTTTAKLVDLANMSVKDMIGAFAFTKGRLPSFAEQKQLTTEGGNIELLFNKLIAQLEGDFTSDLAAVKVEQVAPTLDRTEIFQTVLPMLQRYAEGGASERSKEIENFIKQNKQTADEAKKLEEAGKVALQKQVDAATHLEIALDNLTKAIVDELGLTKGVWALVKTIQKIPGLGADRTPIIGPAQAPYPTNTFGAQRQAAMSGQTAKNLPVDAARNEAFTVHGNTTAR